MLLMNAIHKADYIFEWIFHEMPWWGQKMQGCGQILLGVGHSIVELEGSLIRVGGSGIQGRQRIVSNDRLHR